MRQGTTHRINVGAQYRYNVLQVLWLTCMSEAELERMMMDAGVTWMLSYTRETDEEFVREILNEKELREFWINEWCRRDNNQFLTSLYSMPPNARKARYKLLHEQILFNPASEEYYKLRQGLGRVMDVLEDKMRNKYPCS